MKQLYLFLFLIVFAMADNTNLEEVLHAASNHFTGRFFYEVANENPGKSVVVSAYSVMTPMALLGLASTGPSQEELLDAIGLRNATITKSVFSFAERKLRSVKGVELKTANKIYVALNYELNPEFAAVSRDAFNSEVKNIDFLDNTEAAHEINEWVEDQTNHRIKDLVDANSVNPSTRAILVNALYFKGTWMTTFDKSLTRDRDFHVSIDKVVKIPMMNKKAEYRYRESKILQSKILEMPYVGEEASLMIVLPYKVDGIKEMLEKLGDISVLESETQSMSKVEVYVSIPKFKIETTTDLKDILQKLNIKRIFSPQKAELINLLKEDQELFISSAIQKAFIEVNEEGAEAAAANKFVVTYLRAAIISQEYYFNADHPFLFLLKAKNNILFSGIYYG